MTPSPVPTLKVDIVYSGVDSGVDSGVVSGAGSGEDSDVGTIAQTAEKPMVLGGPRAQNVEKPLILDGVRPCVGSAIHNDASTATSMRRAGQSQRESSDR